MRSTKTTFVVEKKDNFGEWQPVKMSNAHTRGDALILMESIIGQVDPGKYRVMEYKRKINLG